jgi:nucleoside-diphosphate-sugar epimerase
MTKLIFGCGYLGQRVAQRWRDAGEDVVVATRSTERAEALKQQGYGALIADVTRPPTLVGLPRAEPVLFAVGFYRSGGQTIADVYAGGVRNVLAALPAETGCFVYISTTGVYGPAAGEWVDERTPSDPRREGGRASLAAEQILTEHALGRRSVILRLAGLYGPGRIPFLKELQAGEPVPAPSAGFLNLIHVDDAASVVIAASRLPAFEDGPRVYCISDGHPVERGEYYREVARQLGAAPPRFVDPELGSPRAVRAESNRRLSNQKMLRELDIQLAFPDYRAGLAAIL